MYNLKVFIKLIASSFSLKRESLRYISIKRILSVLLFFPLFTIILIINRIFLLLDEIFIFWYRRIKIERAAFIIGVPRSATTYLFNLLYRDSKNFTGFKLWELLFAPSIIQKYLFLGVKFIDKRIGYPVYKLSLLFDRIVFGKFRQIHDMGLTKPEEDEALFLFNLSSLYFYYFFPELKDMDRFLFHDLKVPERVRRQNINFYYRCIQRHQFVFNRKATKIFLSKNPTFIPRMESIAIKFESAKFIYPLRSPYSTIPSTISLNSHIFSSFCKLPTESTMADSTRDFLLSWYIHAERVMRETIKERGITVSYRMIKESPLTVINDLYRFLELEMNIDHEMAEKVTAEKNSFKSMHNYNKNAGIDKNLINEKLKGVIPDELLANN